jgi:thiamine pyrophosphokinase
VLAGGDPVDPGLAARLPAGARVIAADSGLAQAKLLGLTPDLVVGDLDSVEPDHLAEAQAANIPVERHPEDKDATDLELALDRVAAMGHSNVILVGGHGGRLDHLLGNALVLASDRFSAVHTEWWVGDTRVVVARSRERTVLTGTYGDVVSLIAVGGPAEGIVTEGLRWPLDNETLAPGSTRGISNELTGSAAAVTIDSGVLLLIHEGTPT